VRGALGRIHQQGAHMFGDFESRAQPGAVWEHSPFKRRAASMVGSGRDPEAARKRRSCERCSSFR